VGSTIEALVVHHRPLLHAGIRACFEELGGCVAVGEADTVADAVDFCREHEPDLLVVDLTRPQPEPVTILDELARELPSVPVVVIARRFSTRCLRQAVRLGVRGFVCEFASPVHLLEAARSAVAGEYYFGPSAAREMAGLVRTVPEDAVLMQDDGYARLTPREREIFGMLARGLSNKEIAFRLGLSRKTVESHHNSLSRKLGVADAVDLLRYAARIGMFETE
jgi:DNA-binding NarL/FixJ family response regulator